MAFLAPGHFPGPAQPKLVWGARAKSKPPMPTLDWEKQPWECWALPQWRRQVCIHINNIQSVWENFTKPEEGKGETRPVIRACVEMLIRKMVHHTFYLCKSTRSLLVRRLLLSHPVLSVDFSLKDFLILDLINSPTTQQGCWERQFYPYYEVEELSLAQVKLLIHGHWAD